MNESVFQNNLRKKLNKLPHTHFRKVHQGRFGSGMSDLVGCSEGMFYAIECKVLTLPKRGETNTHICDDFTDLQMQYLYEILIAGGMAFGAIYIQDFKQVLNLNYEEMQNMKNHGVSMNRLRQYINNFVMVDDLPLKRNVLYKL